MLQNSHKLGFGAFVTGVLHDTSLLAFEAALPCLQEASLPWTALQSPQWAPGCLTTAMLTPLQCVQVMCCVATRHDVLVALCFDVQQPAFIR